MNNFVQRVNDPGADPEFWNWGGGVNFWNNVGLHAGQCVCGLKMNKLIGRTSHRLCTFSTSVREIKYYFNIWGIRKKKRKKGAQKKVGGGGLKIHPFHLPWIRACHHEYSSKTLNGEVDHYEHSFVWGDKFLKCFSKILQKTLGTIMLTIYNAAKNWYYFSWRNGSQSIALEKPSLMFSRSLYAGQNYRMLIS